MRLKPYKDKSLWKLKHEWDVPVVRITKWKSLSLPMLSCFTYLPLVCVEKVALNAMGEHLGNLSTSQHDHRNAENKWYCLYLYNSPAPTGHLHISDCVCAIHTQPVFSFQLIQEFGIIYHTCNNRLGRLGRWPKWTYTAILTIAVKITINISNIMRWIMQTNALIDPFAGKAAFID